MSTYDFMWFALAFKERLSDQIVEKLRTKKLLQINKLQKNTVETEIPGTWFPDSSEYQISANRGPIWALTLRPIPKSMPHRQGEALQVVICLAI